MYIVCIEGSAITEPMTWQELVAQFGDLKALERSGAVIKKVAEATRK